MNHDKDVILQAAYRRWPEILQNFGFPQEALATGVPCPKCGGNDRFDFSNVGANGSINCRRCASKANGNAVGNGIGAVAWWKDWSFNEACNQIGDYLGLTATQPTKDSKLPRIEARHEIYTTFLSACGLSDEHYQTLQKERGLSREQIEANNYATINEERGLKGIAALVKLSAKGKRGEQIIETPGFKLNERGELLCCVYNGILIPVRDSKGRIANLIVRQDSGKSKYLSYAYKGQLSGNLTAHHAGFPVAGGTVRVTEGPLKGDIASAISGLPTIAIPGVSQWQLANDAIAAAKPAEVLIAFDGDFITNEDVAGAIQKIAEHCKAKAIKHSIETWPAEHKGIDDFLFSETGKETDKLDLPAFRTLLGIQIKEVRLAFNDGRVLARRNLENYARQIDGGKLVWHRDQWWKYKSGRYKMVSIRELEAKIQPVIYAAYDEEFVRLQDEQFDSNRISKRPTREDTNNTVKALESMCLISDSVEMPSWLPDYMVSRSASESIPRRRYISMRNGLLDLDKVFDGADIDELMQPHTPDWFSSFKLDYEFDPYARCPKWINFLSTAMEGDIERMKLLQEWAGYLLTSTNGQQAFLAIEGEGSNGKTVFFAGLTSMLGDDNISNVPLEKFSSSFALASTIGKVANICGDVGQIDSVAEGELKNFTGGGTVYFDRKYQSALEAIPTAKVMLSWNNRPRIVDKTDGFWRRLILVPFQRKVKTSERVIGMDLPSYWLEHGETSGILMWAIEGLLRLNQQKEFTQSSISRAAMEDYQADTNPIRDFVSECLDIDSDGTVAKADIYREYSDWCHKSGYKPWAIRQFGKQLKRIGLELEEIKVGGAAARRNGYRGVKLKVEY